MRYLIISYDDYFNIPYIRYYEDYLKSLNQPYDIVLWSRSQQQVALPNAFVFYGQDRKSKLGKIKPFLGWRSFVRKILKENRYDRLIVLTTMPAVLLADVLLKEYRDRYWLDIRDFTYENFPPYRKLMEKLVYGASHVSISSPAFRQFLPDCTNICLTHNISNQDALRETCTLDPRAESICIGYVGGVQFQHQNQLLLQKFANHPRYRLKYVGKAHLGCDLPAFCRTHAVRNAEFHPAFQNEEKPAIYQDIQLINCVYGDDTPVTRLLLPNRLYDCVLFKIPILVSKNTYLAQVVEAYHLGLALDAEHEDPVKRVHNYLASFDRAAFEAGCCDFLQKTEQEIRDYQNALHAFCSDAQTAETLSVSSSF